MSRLSRFRSKTLAPVVMVLAVLAAGFAHAAPIVGTAPLVGPKKILWTKAGIPAGAPRSDGTEQVNPSSYNDLLFHGGVVIHNPTIYLIFWGTEWQSGFKTGDSKRSYSSATVKNYVSTFFDNVGGTAWHGTQTQFCDNIAPASTSCAGQTLAQYVRNNKHVLAGVWTDPTPVPKNFVTTGLAENLTQDPVAQEAVKASHHFGYQTEALYMVFTPPGHKATAYGTVYCAYHTEVWNPGGHGIKYSFMPFTPEQGAGCGGNSVNAKSDAFGHGYLDSYTLASGHEFEEFVTDPDSFPFQDGWNDYQTSENGDKCAYFHAANLKVGKMYWAVQPMWSNEANAGLGGCAFARGTGRMPIPGLLPDTGFPGQPNVTPPPIPLPMVNVPAIPNPTITLPSVPS